jgi:CRP/FNR family transcriptional regulator, cyclic AMP receptor protein
MAFPGDENAEAQQRLLARFGRHFAAGTVIFRDGESAEHAFLLQSGRVRLLKKVGSMERSLRVARPGDLFGEGALLQGSVQHATAVALEDSVALALDRATFRQVLGSNPEVGARMLEQLIRRLRDAEDQIEILMVRDQHSKVVIALMKLAQQQNEREERPNGQVVLRVSPLELSAHVGLDVDTVKRIVMQLRESGYVRIHEEKVELPDLEHLRELYSLLGVKEQLRGAERERPRG